MIIKTSTTEVNAEAVHSRIKNNFDYMTSEAYYAGNDEFLDNVFMGKRKDEKIYLINRPAKSFSVFSTVFRGIIVCSDGSCYIKGYFGKRYFDYFIFLLLSAAVLYFASEMTRLSSQSDAIGVALIWGVISLFILIPSKKTKQKYTDFLQRIADMNIQ
ncbi:MAG: hypothetical protein PHY15_03510 [Eubacteriales bacterium]|nr:hypothetical protein [Eubacteriales bacterium]MDD4474618.1 hypothetical protein [Eubacteriales bacterium]